MSSQAHISYIGNNAFEECSYMTKITISNGVSIIGKEVFSMCRKLKKVIVPTSVYEIGKDLFKYLDEYGSEPCLYYMGTQEMWEKVNCKTPDLKVYFFSNEYPEENEENYWRYYNGEPVQWGKWE